MYDRSTFTTRRTYKINFNLRTIQELTIPASPLLELESKQYLIEPSPPPSLIFILVRIQILDQW